MDKTWFGSAVTVHMGGHGLAMVERRAIEKLCLYGCDVELALECVTSGERGAKMMQSGGRRWPRSLGWSGCSSYGASDQARGTVREGKEKNKETWKKGKRNRKRGDG